MVASSFLFFYFSFTFLYKKIKFYLQLSKKSCNFAPIFVFGIQTISCASAARTAKNKILDNR